MKTNIKNIKPKTFESISIEGPCITNNGILYMKVIFKAPNCPNSTKCFFKDTHTKAYTEAFHCQTTDKVMKIKAINVQIPTEREFYILDAEGNKQKKTDGTYRKAKSVRVLLLEDENISAIMQNITHRLSISGALIS